MNLVNLSIEELKDIRNFINEEINDRYNPKHSECEDFSKQLEDKRNKDYLQLTYEFTEYCKTHNLDPNYSPHIKEVGGIFSGYCISSMITMCNRIYKKEGRIE